jgi:hypothetical protein
MPPEPGRPQGAGRQLDPQAPQFSLVDKSLSQPLLSSLSQSPKPATQAKSHVPVMHDEIALSGATQALSQQTPSTQNPERHWFGVAAEQATPFGSLGWHSPPLHQLPLTQSSSLPQVLRQVAVPALHLKSPQLSSADGGQEPLASHLVSERAMEPVQLAFRQIVSVPYR